MASFFGRVNYSYKGKYIFTSNLRYDGSSRFVGNRWGLFPSASVAWRASDEFFFDWAKPVLTDAKFRLSWGTNGNERVGNYESINNIILVHIIMASSELLKRISWPTLI